MMNLISPKIFGTLALLSLIIILPTFILFEQKSTHEQQQAANTTCSGKEYFCSQISCLNQHATFATSKTCPLVYLGKTQQTQFCCRTIVSPTP